VLQQLVKWKLLPEEALQDGAPPDSSSTGWRTAEEFVSDLNTLIELEHNTIRETDFIVSGTFRTVYIKWDTGRFDKRGKEVIVDTMGRVIIPEAMLRNGSRKVLGLSFTPDSSSVRRVVSEEPRFEGTNRVATVFYTEQEA
jgi:hypothetical protein